MIFCVADVWGVYKIFPMSSGFSACQIILDIGLESIFWTRLLQYGAVIKETEETENVKNTLNHYFSLG